MGTDKSMAEVITLFSPWAVICWDRSLLREEFVVPEPSLGSSAGTTNAGAHRCGRVCVACPQAPKLSSSACFIQRSCLLAWQGEGFRRELYSKALLRDRGFPSQQQQRRTSKLL